MKTRSIIFLGVLGVIFTFMPSKVKGQYPDRAVTFAVKCRQQQEPGSQSERLETLSTLICMVGRASRSSNPSTRPARRPFYCP